MDEDEGGNADLHYQIVAGNERQKFFIDPKSGVIYPNTSFVGLTGEQFVLTVEVSDEGGERKEDPKWRNPDRATVRIDIENVNTHAPGKNHCVDYERAGDGVLRDLTSFSEGFCGKTSAHV